MLLRGFRDHRLQGLDQLSKSFVVIQFTRLQIHRQDPVKPPNELDSVNGVKTQVGEAPVLSNFRIWDVEQSGESLLDDLSQRRRYRRHRSVLSG